MTRRRRSYGDDVQLGPPQAQPGPLQITSTMMYCRNCHEWVSGRYGTIQDNVASCCTHPDLAPITEILKPSEYRFFDFVALPTFLACHDEFTLADDLAGLAALGGDP